MKRISSYLLMCSFVFGLSTTMPSIASPAAVKALPDSNYMLDSIGTLRVSYGQFVVRLTGKRNDPGFVVTPTVVIRSSDATLIVQTSARRCRVCVLSGSATVKNVVEKHIFQLERGSAYETVLSPDHSTGTIEQLASAPDSDTPAGIAPPGGKDSPRTSVLSFEPTVDRDSCLPAFQTSKARTVLYNVSTDAIKQSRLSALLDSNDWQSYTAAGLPAAHVVSPPTVLSYDIGSRMASAMPIPRDLLHHFPPSGVMAGQSGELVAEGDELAR